MQAVDMADWKSAGGSPPWEFKSPRRHLHIIPYSCAYPFSYPPRLFAFSTANRLALAENNDKKVDAHPEAAAIKNMCLK